MKNKSESEKEVGLEIEKDTNIPNRITVLCPRCNRYEMVIVDGKKTFCHKCDNYKKE